MNCPYCAFAILAAELNLHFYQNNNAMLLIFYKTNAILIAVKKGRRIMIEIDQCGRLLRQIHVAMEKDANNVLREDGLTIAQIYLLFALMDADGGSCTLKEMEKALQIGQSTTVGIVKRLKQKGFVECCNDAKDKRIRIVKITPEGLSICKMAKAKMDATAQKLLGGLTDAEQTEFLRLLRKIQHNFT